MIDQEKTTEIEIPPKAPVIPFRRRATDRQDNRQARGSTVSPPLPPVAPQAPAEGLVAARLPAALTNPWTLRLLAVLVILALSLLVI